MKTNFDHQTSTFRRLREGFASVFTEEHFKEIQTFVCQARAQKSDALAAFFETFETEHSVSHFSLLKAIESHTKSHRPRRLGKQEGWWRVHVWGPVMDSLLVNIPGVDDLREKNSGTSVAKTAKDKIPDMQLKTKNAPPGLSHPISMLHVEEKLPTAPPSNTRTREITIGTEIPLS